MAASRCQSSSTLLAAEGYDFEASKALTEEGSQFVGLALDDENEFDLSEARIRTWCQQILTLFDER